MVFELFEIIDWNMFKNQVIRPVIIDNIRPMRSILGKIDSGHNTFPIHQNTEYNTAAANGKPAPRIPECTGRVLFIRAGTVCTPVPLSNGAILTQAALCWL